MARGRGGNRAGKRGGAASTRGGAAARFGNGDISDDEIDAFHQQRDKVLLGDENGNGRDENSFDALDAGGRSVLNVAEMSSDEGSDGEGLSDDQEYDEDFDEDEDVLPAVAPSLQASKSKGKDVALMADESDESDDEDMLAGSDAEEDQDGAAGWGPNKRAYYSTNDLDDLESDSEMDEEEKRALELREVRKLQVKSRQGMVDDDFCLADDGAVRDISAAAREHRRKDLEGTAPLAQPSRDAASPAQPVLAPPELLAKVQRQTPETLALVGEYADVVDDLQRAGDRLRKLMAKDSKHPSLGLLHLHQQTLVTYIAMLTFYFYQRAAGTSTQDQAVSRLTDTAVIERLAKLKQGLSALEDFGLGLDESDDDDDEEPHVHASAKGIEAEEGEEDDRDDGDDDDDSEDDEEEMRNERISFLFKPPGINEPDSDEDEDGTSLGSLEDDELMHLQAEENAHKSTALAEVRKNQQKKAANTNAPINGKIQRNGNGKVVGKGKKKMGASAPLASVAALAEADAVDDEQPQVKRRKRAAAAAVHSDAVSDVYGEPVSLGDVDFADKEARRRSLKFHTGQIDARDGNSKAAALQGDVDIPYRDKERSRQAVAEAKAAKAAKNEGRRPHQAAALDNDDFGDEDTQAYRDVMGDNARPSLGARGDPGANDDAETGGDTGYYDLVSRGRKAERIARKTEHDEARAAERVAPDDALLEAGEHRGINRQIEKNKGLMAGRRPKTVRNPRVKKRKRYEKAQKKLSSQGPVYKGGQASLQGGYGGETSGISSNVVKSRKFN